MLSIQELSLRYSSEKNPVLERLSLDVMEGEIVVLLGENGAGKSTLLKAIAGINSPYQGDIQWNGRSLLNKSRRERASQIAFVPTHVHYNDLLKVEEFIGFGRYPFTNWLGRLTKEDHRIVQEVIEECDIEHLADKNMHDLSDGERQKVAIARALAQKTDLIILDEPTTHLDIKNTASVLRMLKDQSSNKGKTVLFASHQIERSIAIADKIWLVDGKSVIETAPEVFKKSVEMQKILYGEKNLPWFGSP